MIPFHGWHGRIRVVVLSLLVLVAPSIAGQDAKDSSQRWTAEKARAWAAAEPWALGCNYIPRTAVNTLEMWQASTFDRGDHRRGARLGRGPRLRRRPGLPPLSSLGAGSRRLPETPANGIWRSPTGITSGRCSCSSTTAGIPSSTSGPSRRPGRASTIRAGSNVPARTSSKARAVGGSSSPTRAASSGSSAAIAASSPGTSTTSRATRTTDRSRCPFSKRSSLGPDRPRRPSP